MTAIFNCRNFVRTSGLTATNLEIKLVEFKSWPQNPDKSSNVDNDERKTNQLAIESLSISNLMVKTLID